MDLGKSTQARMPTWDSSSHAEFFTYYAEKSQSALDLQRSRSIRDAILRVLNRRDGADRKYEMVDIGCGAGTQCMAWAELGHRVHGLDINQPLLKLAHERAVRGVKGLR